MDPALAQLGWTDDQWNRICSTVTEEAQKARVAAQVLPVVGPEDGSTVAIPRFTLNNLQAPFPFPQPPPAGPAQTRLVVNSNPELNLTTISVNVPLRGHEVADPNLGAALTMFRRAANYVARVEDALIFNGRTGAPNSVILGGLVGIPPVFTVATDGVAEPGIFNAPGFVALVPPPPPPPAAVIWPPPIARGLPLGFLDGESIFRGIVTAIGRLEAAGQLGPFACVLGPSLFDIACSPNSSFIMARDRILSFLQGPLLRSSAALNDWGAVIALSGNPVEIVVASDIQVQYLQTTLEPRYVFRVVERLALRTKEVNAIQLLFVPGP